MITKEALIHKAYENSDRFRKYIDKSVNTAPSDKQKESENYKKAHIALWGLRIAIENPKGSVRSGIDEKGNSWRTKQIADYGYIKSTVANDGDHLDVYINDPVKSPMVYVVNQYTSSKLSKLDEHKCMVGYASESSARKAYVSCFEYGWDKFDKNLVAFTPDDFKRWIKLDGALKTKAVNPFTKVYSIDSLRVKSVNGSSEYRVSRNEYTKALLRELRLGLPVAVLCNSSSRDKVSSFVNDKICAGIYSNVKIVTSLTTHASMVELSY